MPQEDLSNRIEEKDFSSQKLMNEKTIQKLENNEWIIKKLALFPFRSVCRLILPTKSQEKLIEELNSAKSYEEWEDIARQIDLHGEIELWRNDPESIYYDHKLISYRLKQFIKVSESKDIVALKDLLRSGLLRNLGGINDNRLYTKSQLGTKKLIEDYINQVVYQIEYIRDNDFDEISPHAKVDFFSDTRQSFGGTALLLQGGASFGLYHLGVVKALNEHGLLPRIICGSSVGALIAALVCIHTDEELPSVFETGGIDLKAFAKKSVKGNIQRKISRFLKHGYFLDVKVLEDCVRSNVGDITFEEAFHRTKRVLNITVSSTRKHETPRLLNYLTAPNVLIWSAACTSAAVMGLYETVDLLAKDSKGNIVHWSPSTIDWSDASFEGDSPVTRLSELFNVNHFILSQANPYFAPFLSQNEGLFSKLMLCTASEIQHRLNMLRHIGLLPRVLGNLFLEEKFQGHVTISPPITTSDFVTLLSSPTYASVEYWVLKGERCTWPLLAAIRNRTAIEIALDKALTVAKIQAKITPKSRLKRTVPVLEVKRKSIN